MPYAVAQPLRDQRVAHLRIRLADLPLASGNVTLELGCGHGHFLTAYAAAHPEQLCLGIDLLADRLQRAQRKSSRQGVSNVVWLQAEALDFLRAWPVSARLDRIFALFSDPWPKRRHWKHRLIQPEFLDQLADCARPGAAFYFRTDDSAYFTWTRGIVAAHPRWSVRSDLPWPFEEPTVFQQRAPSFESLIATHSEAGAAQ